MPKEFAEKVGVSLSSIYNYLNGLSCKRPVAYRIQDVTNGAVTADEMLGDKYGK